MDALPVTGADSVVLAGSHMAHDLSVWSWAIIFDKWVTFKSLDNKANKFENSFWSGEALEKIYKRIQSKATDPMARTFCAGMNEWNLTVESSGTNFDGDLRAGLQQRI